MDSCFYFRCGVDVKGQVVPAPEPRHKTVYRLIWICITLPLVMALHHLGTEGRQKAGRPIGIPLSIQIPNLANAREEVSGIAEQVQTSLAKAGRTLTSGLKLSTWQWFRP